jgi:hypothetical protein
MGPNDGPGSDTTGPRARSVCAPLDAGAGHRATASGRRRGGHGHGATSAPRSPPRPRARRHVRHSGADRRPGADVRLAHARPGQIDTFEYTTNGEKITGNQQGASGLIGYEWIGPDIHAAAYIGFNYQNIKLNPNDPDNDTWSRFWRPGDRRDVRQSDRLYTRDGLRDVFVSSKCILYALQARLLLVLSDVNRA